MILIANLCISPALSCIWGFRPGPHVWCYRCLLNKDLQKKMLELYENTDFKFNLDACCWSLVLKSALSYLQQPRRTHYIRYISYKRHWSSDRLYVKQQHRHKHTQTFDPKVAFIVWVSTSLFTGSAPSASITSLSGV